MARTTLDIDAAVMRALKRRQRREGKTLQALAADVDTVEPFEWPAKRMEALVDLDDKDALWRVLDA